MFLTALLAAATISFVGMGPQPASASPIGGKRAAVLMPYSGGGKTWISGESPGVHHHFTYAWAEDLHAGQDIAVQARFQSSDGTITLSVIAAGELNDATTSEPCSPSAGKYVKIRVKVDGVEVGQVLYAHLANVPAFTANQPIMVGDTLGSLNMWKYNNNCWQVTTPAGIHTHMEVQRGCYRTLYANTSYPASTAMGLLSSNYETSNATQCDESEVTAVMTPPAAQDTDSDGVTDAAPDWCIYDKGTVNNRGCPNSIHQLSGDFDGDGKGDAISVSRGPSNEPGLAWFRSTSSASTPALDNPVSLSVVLPAPAWNVDGLKWAAGDFNGDTKSDLLAVSGTPTSGPGLYILLSDGSQFGSPQPVASPNPAYWQWGLLEFFTGDIDGDGKDDVIYSSRGPSGNPGLGWFRSTSNGTTASLASPNSFSVVLSAPAWNTNNLKWSAGDFNGDGKDDLLAVSGSQTDGPGLYILTSNGSQLANPVSVASPNPAYWKWDRLVFMAANVDGDSRDDIVYVSRGPNNDPGLGWFPSTSTATTTSVASPIGFTVVLPAPAWNMSGLKWAILDANGDGKDDVFAVSGAGYSGPGLYILASTGTQLASPVNVGSPNPAYWQWARLHF